MGGLGKERRKNVPLCRGQSFSKKDEKLLFRPYQPISPTDQQGQLHDS